MRPYKDKKNVQAKSYYTDRFHKVPHLPKIDVSEDPVFESDLQAIKAVCEVGEAYIQKSQMVVYVDAKNIVNVLQVLKEELSYNFLSELSAIDWLAQSGKFEIFYQMLSTSKHKRLRIKCYIDEKEEIATVTHLFKSADWAEREMYDMFGVRIVGHHNMKRILMPDDWYDHPLRKTYPLHGDEAASWYEIDKIFGKEYRDIIGPEERDPANIDIEDTHNFSRIKHEVPFGEPYSDKPTDMGEYQEDGGIPIVRKLTKDKSKVLKERK